MEKTKPKIEKCKKCGGDFRSYFLKNGVCNGCRNPHLIVRAVVNKKAEGMSESVDTFGIPVFESTENEIERLNKEIDQIRSQIKASDYGTPDQKNLEFRLSNREERLKKLRDILNKNSGN